MVENFGNRDEKYKIRHSLDPESGILHLSVVDVIGILNLSTDARNYWKTLKNRLKSSQSKLVTKCNQLKMIASDGKMYFTDATDADTMLLLVQHIAPGKVGEFRNIFKQIEKEASPSGPELSTTSNEEYELSVDVYESKDAIVIYAMLAGVEAEDISLVANSQNILIKGHRMAPDQVDDYQIKELSWGKFSREITLPSEINIDEVEINFTHGLLDIKLPKIDKARTRIIKIK